MKKKKKKKPGLRLPRGMCDALVNKKGGTHSTKKGKKGYDRKRAKQQIKRQTDE